MIAIAGDVADEAHRRALADATLAGGGPDALINNAGILGASPPPPLDSVQLDDLRRIYEVNVFAPLRLWQLVEPGLAATRGCVINVTSEAAARSFAGWGGYGSSKAALESLSGVLAVERPERNVYWVDPGDMNTAMEQAGFPDEDVSDRPDPSSSVPVFLRLLDERPPSGRYLAQPSRSFS